MVISTALAKVTTTSPEAEGLTYATYSDWRMPNIIELISIIDYGETNPSIDAAIFELIITLYWSSTTDATNTGNAWRVNFYSAAVVSGTKGNAHPIRPVRDV